VATLEVEVPEWSVEVSSQEEELGSEPGTTTLVRSLAPERGAYDWRAMAAAAAMSSARDDSDDAADERHAGASA